MPCGSAGRRGVETSWQGMPRAHQNGHDVRRRVPAKTACGGGATRASSIGRKLASVEVAQESRDEEITKACVTNNAENVNPRIEESRERFGRSEPSNGGR